MSKISSFIRSIILVAFVVTAAFLCGVRLLQTQLVDGEMYLQMTKKTKEAEQDVDAARGQIVDSSGIVLNTNKTIFNINFQRSMLEPGTENEIIFRVLSVLMKNGEEWNETLPITKTEPYRFLSGKDSAIAKLKTTLNIANYATVDNCIYQLYDTYNIGEKYGEEMRRAIAGVRYEMTIKDFSDEYQFVLASGISTDTVTELKELSSMLPGVDITESWERVYLNGEVGSHVRGTIGAISSDDYNRLKDDGYNLNDVIGTTGVERALESELRGIRGTRTITRGSDNLELSDEITKDPVAGNSVMLTLDLRLQQLVQDAVKYHIEYLHSPHYSGLKGIPLEELEENGCYSGAAVVLDVKTGGVLAMASWPTFDLNEYVNDYYSVYSADYTPLFNRALDGTYRPGSTFKTITATAGLYEGVITPSTVITCIGRYTYFSGYQPACEGIHGSVYNNVQNAIRDSCNVFFNETARRMGIDALARWSAMFGVGTDLNFELPMQTGQMTSIELYESLGLTWNPGDVIQAGIGQSETLLTPLHMAVQAMTLANKGVRYQPHIVKSVYNYDFTEKLYDYEPVIAEDFSGYDGMEDIMIEVREGMRKVPGVWGTNINGVNRGRPMDVVGVGNLNVALKTGTPQASANVTNSAIVAYYPADDPEIAVGIMLERGDRAIYLAANILGAYRNGTLSTSYNEDGIPVGPL